MDDFLLKWSLLISLCFTWGDACLQTATLQEDDPKGVADSAAVINDLIGPFSPDGIVALRGGGLAVANPDDLSCTFEERCCWHNVGGGSDDREWAVVVEQPNQDKAQRHFAVSSLPRAPFAATASYKTDPLTYAFLVSCPILCQTGDAQLSLDHWYTPGVTLDVCTLPLNSRNFTYCETIREEEPIRQTVTVPQQNEPFVIVIVASEFTQEPGGMAAIDNIQYQGTVSDTCQPQTPAPTPAPTTPFKDIPVPFPYTSICNAFNCNSGNCELELKEIPGGNYKTFQPRRRATGEWAQGIPYPPISETYLSTRVRPGEEVGMESNSFDLPASAIVVLDIFEAAYDVDMSSCHASASGSNQAICTEISPKNVNVADRRWKTAEMEIPRGSNQKLLIFSKNSGVNYASVGVASNLRLKTVDGRSIDCVSQTLGSSPTA